MHLGEYCGLKSEQISLEANTLMASMGIIDDFPRIWEARENKPGFFWVQPFSVTDHEKILAFLMGMWRSLSTNYLIWRQTSL